MRKKLEIYIITSFVLFLLVFIGVHVGLWAYGAHTLVPVWLSVVMAGIIINFILSFIIGVKSAFLD